MQSSASFIKALKTPPTIFIQYADPGGHSCPIGAQITENFLMLRNLPEL